MVRWIHRPEVGKAAIDAQMSHGTCYGLREVLVGLDPFDIEQIWELMYRKTNYYGQAGIGHARHEWYRHGAVGHIGKGCGKANPQNARRKLL